MACAQGLHAAGWVALTGRLLQHQTSRLVNSFSLWGFACIVSFGAGDGLSGRRSGRVNSRSDGALR